MSNIVKINNGFILNENTYEFQEFDLDGTFVKNEILSEYQVHIGTNNAVILLDLTCTIDDESFISITEFINLLYAFN